MFEWDEEKSVRNERERGFGFSIVEDFDFSTALTIPDQRKIYGELRYRSLGEIDGKLYVIVWTPRSSNIRIISVRRAREKERRYYEQRQARPFPH